MPASYGIRNMSRPFPFFAIFVAIVAFHFVGESPRAFAQPENDGFQNALQGFNLGPVEKPELDLSASFTIEKGTTKGVLSVKGDLNDISYTYAMRAKSGPATTISLKSPDTVKLLEKFEADSDPKEEFDKDLKLDVERHYQDVIWSVPISIGDSKPEDLKINLTFNGQVCSKISGQCIPLFGETIVAKFTKYTEPPKAMDVAGEFREEGSPVLWKGFASVSQVSPGSTAVLTISAIPDDGFHIYDFSEQTIAKPTVIAITKSKPFLARTPEVEIETVTKDGDTYYDGPVDFEIKLNLPNDVEMGTKKIEGVIGYMACNEVGCTMPSGIKFAFEIEVGNETELNQVPVTFVSIPDDDEDPYEVVVAQAEANPFFDGTKKRDAGEFADYPVGLVLLFAFIAGFILNFMPCVLPVIGLKIMSFVQQAGENPRRVFMLNFVFVLGMILVFMILATLAVIFGLTWGGLYRSLAFKIGMISVIFVFSLSFLGVWEIPIPGFVGTGVAGKAAEKEGYTGAFAKGILTTLLATPCSGPLLIPAVTWAIAQPVWLTYTGFLSLGMGMAFPYLVIGAFPKLMTFLPKPGAWMDTFKQLMGFTLLATAVFLINAVKQEYVTSTLTFLLALAMACWIIGSIPFGVDFSKKLKGWAKAAVVTGVGALIAFFFLFPFELDWKEFSRKTIDDELAKGNVVFVDFTADW